MSDNDKKNCIDWHSWSHETVEKIKIHNKPVFLFISTNASKWSQKMEAESFNDETIIELLNERFIAIKVDKDERPDIERYYQKVYTLMNREMTSSPLSLFLTANLQPFYAGSYIPKEAIEEQLSLEALLRIISKKYITDHDTLVSKGEEVLSFVNPQNQTIQATKLNINIINTIKKHTDTLLDTRYGGFSKSPKFPNTSTLNLLLDVYELSRDQILLNHVTLTLDNMATGGFYDLNNGGFYNYAQDEAWKKPAGIKTTYTNAQLIQLYLRAYNITENEQYKEIALATLDFMLNSRQNNKLFALEDEKIITSWNALMVQTLFSASNIEDKYKINAFESLDALLSELYVSGTLYHCKERDKKPNTQAFLEDYTTLGELLIIAYQNSLDESFLIMATQFSNLLIEQYYEQANWVYSPNEFKLKERINDFEIPSSVASALSLLLSISSLVDNNYKKFVFKTLEHHSYELMRQPLASPKLTQMLLRYLKDDIILKSSESLLKQYINKRETVAYPYLYFKSVVEEGISVENSHSILKKEKTFEKAKEYIESL